MERVAGIEPAYSAWKAAALPLSYTRPIDDRREWHYREFITHGKPLAALLDAIKGFPVAALDAGQ